MKVVFVLLFVLASIVGPGLAAVPAAAASAWQDDIPAAHDDGAAAEAGCCLCGADCDSPAGMTACEVNCITAALAHAPAAAHATPAAALNRARTGLWRGRPGPPDPAPPKRSSPGQA